MFWLVLALLSPAANTAPDVGYWLAGPKGNFYLIGKGQENWINAREFCMHRNADLMSVDNEDSLTWLLQHFMPSPEMPGMVQVGLYRSFFPEWKWLSGTLLQDTKIKANGTDQCATLKLMDATYVSVPCAQVPAETTRFICERSGSAHEQQQKVDNGLWSRLETLFNYLGFGEKKETTTTVAPSVNELSGILEDPGALAKDIEHAEKLLELEASGQEHPMRQAASDNLLPLPDKEEEGSGAGISRELTGEGSGEGSGSWSEEQSNRAEELEKDFNTDDSHVNIDDVPVPPKKNDDCPPQQPVEQTVERLTTLRKFLNRAGHADLQRLVDDDSNSLFDRLVSGISEANEREFGAVQPLEHEKLTDSEREMLFDEMSRLLVPDDRTRDEAMKQREDFV